MRHAFLLRYDVSEHSLKCFLDELRAPSRYRCTTAAERSTKHLPFFVSGSFKICTSPIVAKSGWPRYPATRRLPIVKISNWMGLTFKNIRFPLPSSTLNIQHPWSFFPHSLPSSSILQSASSRPGPLFRRFETFNQLTVVSPSLA